MSTEVTVALIAAAGTVGAASIGGLGAALVAARASRASAASGARIEARLDLLDARQDATEQQLASCVLVCPARAARTGPVTAAGA